MDSSMRAWRTGDAQGELVLTEAAIPLPAPGEVLVKVAACGICRTDLHVVDREIPVRKTNVVPGHQVVGRVVALGHGVESPTIGQLVGVAWLRSTCGVCEWCRSGAENLCPRSGYTGWDVDGAFAEYVTARADYVYRLPPNTDALRTAPLVCAGIIGYRALERSRLVPGGHLGIYGFGSSAHLVAQIAIAGGASVSAMTRGEQNRLLARRLGARFVGTEADAPPEPLDAAIVFAPAGELVPVALRAIKKRRNGRARGDRDVGPTGDVLLRSPIPRKRSPNGHRQHSRGRTPTVGARAQPEAAPVGHGHRVRPSQRRHR